MYKYEVRIDFKSSIFKTVSSIHNLTNTEDDGEYDQLVDEIHDLAYSMITDEDIGNNAVSQDIEITQEEE